MRTIASRNKYWNRKKNGYQSLHQRKKTKTFSDINLNDSNLFQMSHQKNPGQVLSRQVPSKVKMENCYYKQEQKSLTINFIS